jgi:hypothetical protein
VTGWTLRKRLSERGLLASTDNNRQTLTVRRTLEASRRDVLHTSSYLLFIHSMKPDQPDHEPEEPHRNAVSILPLWSDQEFITRPASDHEPDQEPQFGSNGQVTGEHWSGNGQELDHEPDQQEPLIYAEKSAIGQIGQVSDSGKEKDGSEGVRTRRVRGCL